MNNIRAIPLANELPYWEFFDDGKVILNDGSLCGGLKVSLKDIECLDDTSVNQFNQGVRSLLNALPENSVAQFNYSTIADFGDVLEKHERSRTDEHPLVNVLSEKRLHNFKEESTFGTLMRPALTIALRIPKPKKKNLNLLHAFKKEDVFAEVERTAFELAKESLNQALDQISSQLSSLGIESRMLTKNEVIDGIYQNLNPKRSRFEPTPNIDPPVGHALDKTILDQAPWLALQSPREKLIFGDLLLQKDSYVLNSMLHKVLTLKTLPEVTFAGQLAAFLRIPFHYDFRLTVRVPEQASEMARLNQKRKMAHALSQTDSGKASDLESETKLGATEELIRELLTTGQRIFEAEIAIILKDEDTLQGKRNLDRKIRDILARFRSLNGSEGMEETLASWMVKKNGFPFAPIAQERGRRFKTDNLSDFVPIFGPRLGDEDPVIIFKNRLNGLVSFDPMSKNLPNYNSLVTGSSGSGKSFLNNCILLQELSRKSKVFIIDIGGSYKKLTQALDGQYFDFDLEKSETINPFSLPDGEMKPSAKKIKSLLAIIDCMVSEGDGKRLPKLTHILLEKAVVEVYEKLAPETPTLSDLKSLLETSGESELRGIAKMLYIWTGDRPFGQLLDGKGRLSTTANVSAFDLKGLSQYPDLQSVLILILADFLLSECEKDPSFRKRIILDEAWELLKSDSAANLMEYFARTLRKSGSGITFITQGLEEIVGHAIGSAILNNTATKFILSQKGDPKLLNNVLRLNSQESSLVASLTQRKGEFSEAFMIEGDERQVVRVIPSPLEYWISTSDAKDNAHLIELQSDGLILVDAMTKASETYPFGLSGGRAHEKVAG